MTLKCVHKNTFVICFAVSSFQSLACSALFDFKDQEPIAIAGQAGLAGAAGAHAGENSGGDNGGVGSGECASYRDQDADGFGDSNDAVQDCSGTPTGYVSRPGDCDDRDPQMNPGVQDWCNGLDDDCSPKTFGVCPEKCRGVSLGKRGYMFCDAALPWAEAATACDRQHMRLARMDDKTENTFVSTHLTPSTRAWVGAEDSEVEGTWYWPDGEVFYQSGAAVNGHFTNFDTGEPNNGGSTRPEDCLMLLSGGTWNDFYCDEALPYVCEGY